MPLQLSDIPALRAKHIDLLQVRYAELNKMRVIWQATAGAVIMLTATITLSACVLSKYSVSILLMLVAVSVAEYLFIGWMRLKDWHLFYMAKEVVNEFGKSIQEGFDRVPDFTQLFRANYYQGDLQEEYGIDGAHKYFTNLSSICIGKLLVALLIIGLNWRTIAPLGQ